MTFAPRQQLFRGVADGSFVYFCHSYYGPVTPEACAVTEYGQTFAAGIEMNKIWAVQFHPEKSGEVGLKVLKNFLEACKASVVSCPLSIAR